jgi:hypothetical protein
MKTQLGIMLISVTLASCASLDKLKHDDGLKYQDYAGDPIQSFWMPRLDGWTVVDDKLLVLRTNINKEYLVKVAGFCPDLKFANAIGVTSFSGSVDKFEKILVGKDKCMISEIRPIDSARMKADRKALREKKAAEKAQAISS